MADAPIRIEYHRDGETTRVRYEGTIQFTAVADKNVVIGTYPPNLILLEGTVPAGKDWNVIGTLSIQETDA